MIPLECQVMSNVKQVEIHLADLEAHKGSVDLEVLKGFMTNLGKAEVVGHHLVIFLKNLTNSLEEANKEGDLEEAKEAK